MRRIAVAAVVLAAIALAGGPRAEAQQKAKVGVLKLTSSAPVFIGVERGYFTEFGVEPELV
jgi:NitT/TauT family transport system substrate-binding protein